MVVRIAGATRGVLHARELDTVELHLPLRTARPDPSNRVLCDGLGRHGAGPAHRLFERGRNPRVRGGSQAQRLVDADDGFLVERRAADFLNALGVNESTLPERAAHLVGFGVAVLHPRPELLGRECTHFGAVDADDAVLDRTLFAFTVVVVEAVGVAFEQVALSGRGRAAKRFEAALAHRLIPSRSGAATSVPGPALTSVDYVLQ